MTDFIHRCVSGRAIISISDTVRKEFQSLVRIWRINGSFPPRWRKRCSKKRGHACSKACEGKQQGKAPVLIHLVFLGKGWDGVSLLLGREAYTRNSLLPMECEQNSVCQEPAGNLPCFLLLISAPAAIADTFWTHRVSNQWAFVLLRGWHLGAVCCYSLNYRILNEVSVADREKGGAWSQVRQEGLWGQIVKSFVGHVKDMWCRLKSNGNRWRIWKKTTTAYWPHMEKRWGRNQIMGQ